MSVLYATHRASEGYNERTAGLTRGVACKRIVGEHEDKDVSMLFMGVRGVGVKVERMAMRR